MRMTKRIWMTGCMALVLVAAGRPASAREDQDDPDQRSQRTRVTLTSKYDLDETVRQVERSVRRAGLPVVARTVPKGAQGDAAARDTAARVLVLGDADGRTPIVQADAGTPPELPWQVVIRPLPDGRAEVSLPAAEATVLPDEVQASTLEKVTALRDVLESVIT